MRKVDPSIKLIAGGAMPDVMEGADQARRINGQYVPDYLSSADWTGQLLLNCLDNIDMVSEHYYASGTQHTDMKLQKRCPSIRHSRSSSGSALRQCSRMT